MNKNVKFPYSFKETLIVDVPEHEVVLSFNDDAGAYCFHEWWLDEGQKLFDKYSQTFEE